jgi:hypothetical protein
MFDAKVTRFLLLVHWRLPHKNACYQFYLQVIYFDFLTNTVDSVWRFPLEQIKTDSFNRHSFYVVILDIKTTAASTSCWSASFG